jgi:hypothetical protein
MKIAIDRKRNPPSITKIQLLADIVLFIGVVWALMPQATGIPLHEWGSLLVIIPFLIHLVLDWQWIIAVTKRFFKRQSGEVRFNYFWNWFQFMMMVIACFSGILISNTALPAIGIPIVVDPFWLEVHLFSANSVMIMLGVHLAMHWQWITANFKRYILRPTPKNGVAA